MTASELLAAVDPEISAAIRREEQRQREGVELIASENYTSEAVMAAVGSVLTNKYAEGLPGKRYYGGCEFVDIAEELAIDRAKSLFGAQHANVQPHSGANANLAAYFSLMEPGDTILGLSLSEGGHLTHGTKVNFSGRFFHAEMYGVDAETGLLDYDAILAQAKQVRPRGIICGASAYSRTIDFKRFREIADEVGAYLFADIAHIAGLVVAGEHPTSLGHAHITTTTTHKTLRGPRGGLILSSEEYAKAIDKTVFPGMQGGPLMHVIAGKAVSFLEAMQPSFKVYARQVIANARAMAAAMQERGFPVISGGTDNHLFMVDVGSKDISGRKAERILDTVGISANRNTIPGDIRPPTQASGLRIGTPAMTTRGFREAECVAVAELIAQVLEAPEDEMVLERVRANVLEVTAEYPVPGTVPSAMPVTS